VIAAADGEGILRDVPQHQKRGRSRSVLEVTKGEDLVATRLWCGSAPVREGRLRQLCELLRSVLIPLDLCTEVERP
jgi:hypothetical protein